MDKPTMNKDVSESFESHFGILKDPRIKRLKLYPLTEIKYFAELYVALKAGEILSFLAMKSLFFYDNTIHLNMGSRQKIHLHVCFPL
jgi:hypothetical protein